MARLADAAMVALHRSGVPFREVGGRDGAVERWKEPELANWARAATVAPDVSEQRRDARRRWLERRRAYDAAQRAVRELTLV